MKKNWPLVILIISVCVTTVCVTIIGYKLLLEWVAFNNREEELVNKDEEDKEDDERSEVNENESETQKAPVDLETEEILEHAISLATAADGEEDVSKALELFKEAAEEGNSDAQFFAGEMYLQGMGAEADIGKAAEYIKQAFDNGNRNAYSIYAKMSFMGAEGISQDYEKAAAIFHILSDDSAEASYMLGLMHTFGMGVPIAYDVAEEYLLKAEEQGYGAASAFHNVMQSWVTGEKSGTIEYAQLENTVLDVEYSEELREKVNEFAQALLQSEVYDAFLQEQAAIEKMDISIASNITLFGKNNWLFMQNPNDGSSYHDYIGDNAYTDKEMASIAKHLTEQKENIEAAGLEFVLLIIPNKEIIYDENMPSYIERVSNVTRTDKLVEYLKNNTELDIIYLKDIYNKYKDNYQLYYKTDSHCNMQGSFIAVAELMNLKYQKQLSLENVRFDIHMNNYCGDLGVMLGRQDRYSMDTVYFLPASCASEEDKTQETLLLVGDSFSEFLNTEASYFFNGGVEHVMIMDYGYDYYNATKSVLSQTNANIVLWECAERYIDRLK